MHKNTFSSYIFKYRKLKMEGTNIYIDIDIDIYTNDWSRSVRPPLLIKLWKQINAWWVQCPLSSVSQRFEDCINKLIKQAPSLISDLNSSHRYDIRMGVSYIYVCMYRFIYTGWKDWGGQGRGGWGCCLGCETLSWGRSRWWTCWRSWWCDPDLTPLASSLFSSCSREPPVTAPVVETLCVFQLSLPPPPFHTLCTLAPTLPSECSSYIYIYIYTTSPITYQTHTFLIIYFSIKTNIESHKKQLL